MRSARYISGLIVFLAVLLAGCGTTKTFVPAPEPSNQLPPIPEDLRQCFTGTVSLPTEAIWSSKQAAAVIADLRKSELSKTDCGRRLIQFYSDVADEEAKKQK